MITSGLKSNRWLRIEDPSAPEGWRWQWLSDSTAQLSDSDYIQLKWTKGNDDVYVHVVSTRVRKLYSCQVVIVRQSLDAPGSQTRYWTSSDLEAKPEILLWHIAARWDIEIVLQMLNHIHNQNEIDVSIFLLSKIFHFKMKLLIGSRFGKLKSLRRDFITPKRTSRIHFLL